MPGHHGDLKAPLAALFEQAGASLEPMRQAARGHRSPNVIRKDKDRVGEISPAGAKAAQALRDLLALRWPTNKQLMWPSLRPEAMTRGAIRALDEETIPTPQDLLWLIGASRDIGSPSFSRSESRDALRAAMLLNSLKQPGIGPRGESLAELRRRRR